MITPDSVVVGVEPQDISLDRFLQVQRDAFSPAAASAGAAYVELAKLRVSIAFLLAVFGHESTYATNPAAIVVKYDTKNPGNCRTPRTGPYPVIDTPRGRFVQYPDWVAGWCDLSYRLFDPAYVYVQEGRTTIRQVIERFAPASDNNRPDAYVNAVVADMNAWIESAPMAGFEMPADINGVPVRKAFIPAGNSNRPGEPANAAGLQWITVHETANPNAGANAEMHRRFAHGANGYGGGGHPAQGSDPAYEGVSFTFCVDDHEIVWLLPLEEKSWQSSDGADGTGNSSVSIETCVNVDGDWSKTRENLSQLVAYLAGHAPGRSIDRVAQHNKWARDHKNCPTRMRANNGAEWNAMLTRAIEIGTPPADPARLFPETGHSIAFGFRAFWEQFGDDATSISIFGYPLTEEISENGRTVQYFERAVFEYWPENPEPHRVLLRRLGADLLDKAA